MFVRVHSSKFILLFGLAIFSISLVSCGESDGAVKTTIVEDLEEEIHPKGEDSTDDELRSIIESAGIKPDTNASLNAFKHSWTNGNYWISPEVVNNHELERNGIQILEFMGGDRHEGGYDFQAALLNDSTVIVLSSSVIECDEGDLLELNNLADIDYIKILNPNRETKGVFVRSNLTLGNDIDIKVQNNLAGTFFEKTTGDTIQFIDSIKTVIWNSEAYNFTFESDEVEALVDVITFNNQSMFFQRDSSFLKLTKAQLNEDDSFIEWLPSGEPRYFKLISKSDELTFKDFLNKVK